MLAGSISTDVGLGQPVHRFRRLLGEHHVVIAHRVQALVDAPFDPFRASGFAQLQAEQAVVVGGPRSGGQPQPFTDVDMGLHGSIHPTGATGRQTPRQSYRTIRGNAKNLAEAREVGVCSCYFGRKIPRAQGGCDGERRSEIHPTFSPEEFCHVCTTDAGTAENREERIEVILEGLRPKIEATVRQLVERAVDVPEAQEFGAIDFEFRDAGQELANEVRQAGVASRKKRGT